MNCIQTQLRDGINLMKGYDDLVNSVTGQDLADMAKTILNGYKKEVVQLPE